MALFSMFKPCRARTVRMSRSDALIVDVNFLGAVLALRIAGSMDDDLLDKLMQDTWSQFRNFRIPFYNGEKPLYLRTPAESRQAIFFV